MDKRVLVLGLGRSGIAAANLLRDQRAHVVAFDQSTSPSLEQSAARLRERGIETRLAVSGVNEFSFDLVVTSPGIDPRQPLVQSLAERKITVIGELELGYLLCPCPIIAITGTNGKTTTTELVDQVLRAGGKRTLAAGNIGHALCDAVRCDEPLDALSVEVSSFQLESIRSFHPRVSVLLNITPDHLDRYNSLQDYASAKARVFENQTADDFAVINADTIPQLTALGIRPVARLITFSDRGGQADYRFQDGAIWRGGAKLLSITDTHLRGPHNAQNIMAALAVAETMSVPLDAARRAVCEYRPRPHRCEFVATVDGVDYINDSKATNPDAVEKALAGMTRPVILIAGGKDKGFDFSALKPAIQAKVRRVILIGETAPKLLQCWGDVAICECVTNFEAAVRAAQLSARQGNIVLLSPACSSFDMFKDFEDRGEQFKTIVRQLVNQTASAVSPSSQPKPKKGKHQ